mgnify:CR=1 FL=1|tara:strand:- start:3634 stop:4227 length:594 start_codon:yes stop_codon:yes gene_type:complete
MIGFEKVKEFENKIAEFFGAPYGVAVDCCTHGLELCLIHKKVESISIPTHTYISIPFLAKKLNLEWKWREEKWSDYYFLKDSNIIDAAVFWRKGGYIPNTYMVLSFQFQKHLSLGRGGMILTDDQSSAEALKKMSYDGRLPDIPWRQQNIESIGYHYYMPPEVAQKGIDLLPRAAQAQPRKWSIQDYPDLRKMKVFK